MRATISCRDLSWSNIFPELAIPSLLTRVAMVSFQCGWNVTRVVRPLNRFSDSENTLALGICSSPMIIPSSPKPKSRRHHTQTSFGTLFLIILSHAMTVSSALNS